MSAINLKTNPLILFITIVAMVTFASSCARRMTFTTSRIVPSAEGRVKIKKDRNNNYAINLKVRNLPDPKRFNPSRKTYMVWMETVRNGTRNIGNLNTSGSLFSKTLKSSLNTVTPYKPTGFFITAENAESITYPNGEVVLRAE